MRFGSIRQWSACVLLVLAAMTFGHPLLAPAQTELTRKVRVRVEPTYPDLARRMNLQGAVKLMVIVLPNGNVKDTKVMGGNPILVNAAMDALKKWKFEPGPA